MGDNPGVSPGPSKAHLALVVLAVLLGGALRVAYAFKGGMWRDEAQAIGIATMPDVGDMLAFLIQHESHPPGYYFLLRSWIGAFGTGDGAILSLSLLCGVALIPLAFVVVRRMRSVGAGVLAAGLVSVHPGLIQYSASVRPYALLSLLTVVLLFFLWRILQDSAHRAAFLIGYWSTAVAMVYLHHWAWLVLISTGLLWLILGVSRRGMAELKPLVVVHLLLGLAYAPWIDSLLHQSRSAGHLPSDVTVLQVVPWSLFAIAWLQPIIAAALLVVTVVLYRSTAHDAVSLSYGAPLLLTAGVPVLSAVLTCLLLPVANLTTLWCYSIVSGAYVLALAILMEPRPGAGRPLLSAAIPLTWIAVMLVTWLQIQSSPRANTREIAEYVRSRIGSTDQLVVVPGYLVPSFYRYFGSHSGVYSLPEDSLSAYIPYDRRRERDLDARPWVRLLESIDASARACRPVWMIVESGTPPHMQRLVAHLLNRAEQQLGPPEVRQWPVTSAGVVEHSSVRHYRPCSRSDVAGQDRGAA